MRYRVPGSEQHASECKRVLEDYARERRMYKREKAERQRVAELKRVQLKLDQRETPEYVREQVLFFIPSTASCPQS